MSGLFSTSLVSSITADAIVPEQLVHYVTAVSSLEASLCGSHVLYRFEDTAVFVIFDASWCCGNPLFHFTDSQSVWKTDERVVAEVREALIKLPSMPKILTVLAPLQAELKQTDCESVQNDTHWFLPLPLSLERLPSKVRNMIRHGERLCRIEQEPWSAEHGYLVSQVLASKSLPAGTRHIYKNLSKYAQTSAQGARLALISARTPHDNALQAFIIGDLSSLTTAFYMFAFRTSTAPAGTADALLFALAKEVMSAGHTRLSLGLGINGGVANFKKKWNAVPYLPHVETVLTCSIPQRKSFLSRFFK